MKKKRVVLGEGILVANGLSFAIVRQANNQEYWPEVYPGKTVRLVAEVLE